MPLRFILTLCCCLFLGCRSRAEQPNFRTKVGVLLPLSGDFRSFGEISRGAIEEQQYSPLVDFHFEDSACDAKKALDAFRKLSKIDGIRLFLGPCCGNELESIAPVIAGENKLVLSLCSSTGGLFERSKEKILSPVFSIEAESEFMANQVERRGLRRIAVVYYNNSFSAAHEVAFRRALKKAEVSTLSFDSMDPEAVRGVVLKLRKNPPDAIYVPDLTPFLLSLAKQLRNTGLDKLPIFSIHAAETQALIASEGSAVNGIIYSHPDTDKEPADHYYSRIAAKMIDEAVQKCADDAVCIKTYLQTTYPFAPDGTMKEKIILRTVADGKFVDLNGDS